jgi:hypothetical protein
MISDVGLIASIAETRAGRYVAAYIGAQALQRLAATETFATREAAREWVMAEADAIGLDVIWTRRALMGAVQQQDDS